MNEGAKLSEETLFGTFVSLNVPIRVSDLKTPTKDFVITVFDTFLRDLHINLGNPALIPFECISHIDDPDIYEKSQNYILLAATMNKILNHLCRNPVTITFSDIVAPKPKKTKKIFNFLVVVWIDILKKQELFSQVCNRLQPEIQKAEELIQENAALDEKHLELVEKLNSIKTPREELLKESALKQEMTNKLEGIQKEIISDYQKLKEKESALQTEKVNLDLTIATIKETLSELEQGILSSPEKIKSDAQKLKDMIKEVEEKIAELENEKKEKKKENQSKISAQEDLLKSNVKIQKLLNELQSLMEIIKALSILFEKCQEENKELKELQSAHETKELMTNFYEEKLNKIQHVKKKQIEEYNQNLELLQSQLSEKRMNCKALECSIAEMEKTIENKIDSVVSIVKSSKKAEVETKEYKSLYKQQLSEIYRQFKEDCEEVICKARNVFKD